MRVQGKDRARAPQRKGVQLLDVVLSSTLLLLVLGSVTRSFTAIHEESYASGIETDLLQGGRRALRSIVADLRHSGFSKQGGLRYPHLFEEGKAGADFAAFDHDAPVRTEPLAHVAAVAPEPVAREVVFRLPGDADADGMPDLDADGNPSWDDSELGYVLIPDGDSNRLERRIDGAPGRVLARNVESMVFDDAVSSGFEVPLGCLRVRLVLAKRDADGRMLRRRFEATVRLRNGGLGW